MNPKEFARRRRQLMRMMGNDGIAILPAAPVTAIREIHMSPEVPINAGNMRI